MAQINKEKALKIAGIVGNVLIWVFVAFSLLITILVFAAQGSEDGVPSIFGKSLVTIETPSMEDTYMMGDLVFMTKLDDEAKSNLKPGDIITYHAPIDINEDGKVGDINTHRVVSNDTELLKIVTKGDNNLLPDNEGDDPYTLHYSDIIGICDEDSKLAGVGNAINFLRSSLGFFLCIVLPLILFFLFELYNFVKVILAEKAKKAPVSAETEEEIKKRAIEEYLKAQEAAKAAENEAAENEAAENEAAAKDAEAKADETAEEAEKSED